MPRAYQLFLESQRATEGSTWQCIIPLVDERDQPIAYQRITEMKLSLRSLEDIPNQAIFTNVDVRGNREHGVTDEQGNYALTLTPLEVVILERERDLPWLPKRRATIHYGYDQGGVQNIIVDFSINRL